MALVDIARKFCNGLWLMWMRFKHFWYVDACTWILWFGGRVVTRLCRDLTMMMLGAGPQWLVFALKIPKW
jgi:hypothetical protein